MSRSVYRIHRDNGDTPDPETIGIYAEIRQLSEVEPLYQYEDLIAAPPEIQTFARIRLTALRARLFGHDELRGAA